MLRNHFNARTTAFLAPLSRYLNTLIPLPSETVRIRGGEGEGRIGSGASSTVSLVSEVSSASSLPLPTRIHAPAPNSIPNSTRMQIQAQFRLSPSPAPSPSPMSLPTPTSRLKPFNTSHFLASLKTHGSPLPFRSSAKQREFYERWLRTPAFGVWLAKQEEVVGRVLGAWK